MKQKTELQIVHHHWPCTLFTKLSANQFDCPMKRCNLLINRNINGWLNLHCSIVNFSCLQINALGGHQNLLPPIAWPRILAFFFLSQIEMKTFPIYLWKLFLFLYNQFHFID